MVRFGAAWLAAFLSVSTADATTREWHFDVTADGIPIGTYTFVVTEDGASRRVVAEAKYRVRLLVVDAFSYEHHDEETWQGDCLVQLATRTIERGRTTIVTGRAEGAAFVIESPQGRESLPTCPMTFAYWNPHILERRALINTQTGAWTPVTVTALGEDRITVRGETVHARRYRMETERTVTDVWYSAGGDWLGLRGTTRSGGHTLTYRLR
jgi:hypothetical protein